MIKIRVDNIDKVRKAHYDRVTKYKGKDGSATNIVDRLDEKLDPHKNEIPNQDSELSLYRTLKADIIKDIDKSFGERNIQRIIGVWKERA